MSERVQLEDRTSGVQPRARSGIHHGGGGAVTVTVSRQALREEGDRIVRRLASLLELSEDRGISEAEAARIAGLGRTKLRDEVAAGRFPPGRKVGEGKRAPVIYSRSEVLQWIRGTWEAGA